MYCTKKNEEAIVFSCGSCGTIWLIMSFLVPIRTWLDSTAMYRVVTLALLALTVLSLALGTSGRIPYSVVEQGASLLAAVGLALALNIFYSWLFKVKVNNESALITALLAFFLVMPPLASKLWVGLLPILGVVFLAITSKFVLVWKKQHIFNPVAVGSVLLMLMYYFVPSLGFYESAWWPGQPEFFIPLVFLGSLVMIKTRSWWLVVSFLLSALAVLLLETWRFDYDFSQRFLAFWLSGPSLFLAFFMLTEPFTLPPTRKLRIWYGVLVGVLSQTMLLAAFVKMTPELALVFGNLVFYFWTLRHKLILPLVEKKELAKGTFEFAFEKPAGVRWRAGQYLEWMLPHQHSDNRGIRRYFTIASVPEDKLIRIGVRIGEEISSYKTKLKDLAVDEEIIASQLAGDFVLPKNPSEKLAFIAGGIGITPFVSQLEEMEMGKKQFDTVLFFGNNTRAEVAYFDKLKTLETKLPLKIVFILAKEEVVGFETGFVTAEMVKKHTPDFLERTWYLSGPPIMVRNYSQVLRDLGVSRWRIKKDFFPGLA